MLNIPNGVRKILRQDNVLKNVRISFPNGEKSDICNDRLVRESLKFDESISSREEIQFGLCESSVLSFECVDVGNIKGLEIAAAIEVDVSSAINQSHKASPYTPVILKGKHDGQEIYVLVTDMFMGNDGDDYLSADGSRMSWDFHAMPTFPPSTLAYTEDMSLDYFRDIVGVDPRGTRADWYDGLKGGGYSKLFVYSVVDGMFYPCSAYSWTGSFRKVDGLELMPIGATTEGAFTDADLVAELGGISFDAEDIAYYSTDAEVEAAAETADDVPFSFYSIPLGHFVVDECKRDASMRMRKVVAYSKDFDFNVPAYIRDAWLLNYDNISYIDLNILNYGIACNNSLFDTTQFTFTPLSLEWAGTIAGYQSRHIGGDNYEWQYQEIDPDTQEITIRELRLTISVNCNDALYPTIIDVPFDMQHLIRCNHNGISDARRAEILAEVNDTIIPALETYDMPSELESAIRVAVTNALYPFYEDSWMEMQGQEHLFGIKIGSIYSAFQRFHKVSYIGFELYDELHSEIFYSTRIENVSDEPNLISYDAVDTSVLPQNFIRISAETEEGYTSGNFYQAMMNFSMQDGVKQSAELQGKFGRFNRYGLFELLEIADVDIEGLYPNPDLFPADNLYPAVPAESITDTENVIMLDDDDVMSLWYEEYFIQFGRIHVVYLSSEILDADNNPTEVAYDYEWDGDKRMLTYDLSSNEILTTIAHTAAEMRAFIAPLVEALKELKFYPSEVQHIGLPYMEAGDWELVSMRGNKVLTLVLSRTMSGIQLLTDKVKSD